MSERKERENNRLRDSVREAYGRIAEESGSCCGPSKSCCGQTDTAGMAPGPGYSDKDLGSIPEGADMGLSCGNPTALASLGEGETVADLGSGGGLDIFIAGRAVGPAGHAIGVDMTPEMLARARRNIESYRESSGLDNVEFRLGEIEHLPLADSSVDVVISNCVINLSVDKPRVWREIFRVLRPGGRVAVSDLALVKPLPEAVSGMVEAYTGCIAGAVTVEETVRMAGQAGLIEIVTERKPYFSGTTTGFKDPLYRRIMEALPEGDSPGDYIVSLNVSARKA